MGKQTTQAKKVYRALLECTGQMCL